MSTLTFSDATSQSFGSRVILGLISLAPLQRPTTISVSAVHVSPLTIISTPEVVASTLDGRLSSSGLPVSATVEPFIAPTQNRDGRHKVSRQAPVRDPVVFTLVTAAIKLPGTTQWPLPPLFLSTVAVLEKTEDDVWVRSRPT